MLLIFDTNVLLAENRWELLEYFSVNQSPPKFLVALDQEQNIINEYLEYARRNDPESPIRKIVERLIDGSDLFVVDRPATHLSNILSQILTAYSCTDQVEVHLLGVAESRQSAALVVPNDISQTTIHRKYLGEEVRHTIAGIRGKPVILTINEVLRILRDPAPYSPSTMGELKDLLAKYAATNSGSDEQEYIEFKCPVTPYLTQQLLREATRAVCAMLNTCNGWVFIGVDDPSGEIKPFPPRYKTEKAEPRVSQLVNNIYEEIDRILPNPGRLVRLWPILDDNKQNCVIAIHIRQGIQEYRYRNRDNDPKNEKLGKVKWVRRGARTVPEVKVP